MTHEQILLFLAELRDAFPGSEEVFTRGSCFRLYRMLRVICPDAECWYDMDHAITRIGGRWYDITGEVSPGRHEPLSAAYGRDQARRLLELRYSNSKPPEGPAFSRPFGGRQLAEIVTFSA